MSVARARVEAQTRRADAHHPPRGFTRDFDARLLLNREGRSLARDASGVEGLRDRRTKYTGLRDFEN